MHDFPHFALGSGEPETDEQYLVHFEKPHFIAYVPPGCSGLRILPLGPVDSPNPAKTEHLAPTIVAAARYYLTQVGYVPEPGHPSLQELAVQLAAKASGSEVFKVPTYLLCDHFEKPGDSTTGTSYVVRTIAPLFFARVNPTFDAFEVIEWLAGLPPEVESAPRIGLDFLKLYAADQTMTDQSGVGPV